ncbi:DUF817 domain-containing protein [Gulosibacter chungangensis]|uniref:DUF817 domain-containing protein n=1 Tax=Gulosibacter chungangensis TaxID=979746 RepID=A0A7J5BAV2_9MICO|nr:DUF817 domain-containing protein [Gulosibacter chungangensis]KAB1642147.1 DUF817 domain-containing protein [Gulosibacter chungangensis]
MNSGESQQPKNLTSVERFLDRTANRWLASRGDRGLRSGLLEFLVFGLKQAWACLFGALMLIAIIAARLWWPDDATLARNDALVIVAVGIQVLMLVTRLETGRELWVIMLFHITGTIMELFKTGVGSWLYDPDGVLRIAGVPLFTGFMYAAVGSYMVRVYRLMDLRFDRYPRLWLTAILALAAYANFFTHHFVWDARWLIVLAVVVTYWPTWMHFRVYRRTFKMPILVAFGLVATFIWFAENIATWAGAWAYPDQVDGWEPVSIMKLVSWFLLMLISVVLVTVVYPPRGIARQN